MKYKVGDKVVLIRDYGTFKAGFIDVVVIKETSDSSDCVVLAKFMTCPTKWIRPYTKLDEVLA